MRLLAPVILVAAVGVAHAERPAVGAIAPAFSLASSTGKTVSLADFRNKKRVVLAFFPKAFTGG